MPEPNQNPLAELKSLDAQVDQITTLDGLKPIFTRLEEIARDHPYDFETQLLVGDIKQHMVNRGVKIRQTSDLQVRPPSDSQIRAADAAQARPPVEDEPTIVIPPTAPAPAVPAVPPAVPAAAQPQAPPPVVSAPVQPSPPPPAAPPQMPPPAAANVRPPVLPAVPPQAPPPVQNRKTVILRPDEMAAEAGIKPIPVPGPPPVPAPSMPNSTFDEKTLPSSMPPAAKPPVAPPPPAVPPPSTPNAGFDEKTLPSPLPVGARPPIAPPSPAPAPQPTMPKSGFDDRTMPLPPPASARPPAAPPPPPAPMPAPPGPTAQPGAPPMKPPQAPVKPAVASSSNWKIPVTVGAVLGILLAMGGIAFLRNRQHSQQGTAAQQVAITTKPTGAAIRIVSATGAETKCTSDCNLSLDPGSYEVTALLDGYEPSATRLTIGSAKPADVVLALEPQAQTVRVLTDLPSGKVVLDNEPPRDLQDGQVALEKVSPGMHVLKLTSPVGVAQVPFEIADGAAPKISGPVTTSNLFALLVSTLGNKARVTSTTGPLKLVVNGQPQDAVTPAGVDLKDFQGGVTEFTAGEGKDQRNVKETFTPTPTLTVFLKSDLNIGTLIVASSEDDSRVFVNGKEYARHTQRGQVRIPILGPVVVRVMKEGFDAPPQQTAEVKKGTEVRLDFKLKPANQLISLVVRGGTPGAEVFVDGRSLGLVGPDGNFSGTVAAGDHVVELRRDQYSTKRLERSFRLGQPVTISGPDAILALDRPVAPPPKEVAVAPPPPPQKIVLQAPKAGTMDDWDNPNVWRKEDDAYVHRGAAHITYKLPPQGTFTFTVQLQKGGNVFRSGRIRWATNYLDAKNYALYEIDSKTFWAKVIENGKTAERAKMSHGIDAKDKSFTIQLEIAGDHITHRIQRGGQWVVLDNWNNEPGRNFADGKFAFIIQGDDQIAISDFKFQPQR